MAEAIEVNLTTREYGKMLKRILLGSVLAMTIAGAAFAAHESWAGQGEIVVSEAITVTWDSGDGSWDLVTSYWTVFGYPGETVTAKFRVQNDSSESLQVIATVVVDQTPADITATWTPASGCIEGNNHEQFELDATISAEAAPGTLLISFTFQREACP